MNKNYVLASALIILTIVSVVIYRYRQEYSLRLEVLSTTGCSEPTQKNHATLTISKSNERYDLLGENQKINEVILSDFQNETSWILNPQKKHAVLLVPSPQKPASTFKGAQLMNKHEVECMSTRRCIAFEFKTPSDEIIEIQTLDSPLDGTELWKYSQKRDTVTWGDLKSLIEKDIGDQPIVSMKISGKSNCRQISVLNARLLKYDISDFQMPPDYIKNPHSDLHKLPPEVRESILRKEKVQILEAKPVGPTN